MNRMGARKDMDGRDGFESTALIIIAMQRDFCERGGYAAKAGLDVERLSSIYSNDHYIYAVAL